MAFEELVEVVAFYYITRGYHLDELCIWNTSSALRQHYKATPSVYQSATILLSLHVSST